MSHKKITSASLKKIGVPKTVREKYDKLKTKNKNIDLLRDTFSLEIGL